MNCGKLIKIILIFFLWNLTESAISSDGNALDKLYARYLLSTETELPIKARDQLRRLISAVQFDREISAKMKIAENWILMNGGGKERTKGKPMVMNNDQQMGEMDEQNGFISELNDKQAKEISETPGVINDKNKLLRKDQVEIINDRTREMSEDVGVINDQTEINDQELRGLIIDPIKMIKQNIEDIHCEMRIKIQMEVAKGAEALMMITEAEICHFWALNAHLKQFLEMTIRGEKRKESMMGIMLKMVEQLKKCDRIEEEMEKRELWMIEMDAEVAKMHKGALEGLMKNESPRGRARNLKKLFEGKPEEGENELIFQLKRLAMMGDREGRLKNIKGRILELARGRQELFQGLINGYTDLNTEHNTFDWLQSFYGIVIVSRSEADQKRNLMNIDLLTYIRWINELISQKELGQGDWPKFRGDLADYFDSPGSVKSDEIGEKLEKLHRLKIELSRKTSQELELGKWTVEGILAKSQKWAPGKRSQQMQEEMEQAHAEMLESMVEERKWFRQVLLEMSGVELIQRLTVLISHSQLPIIGKIIRKCRKIEGLPKWYGAIQKPVIDQCPAGMDKTIKENHQDIEAVNLSNDYIYLLKQDDLFRPSGHFDLQHSFNMLHQLSVLWLFTCFIDELLLAADYILDPIVGIDQLGSVFHSLARSEFENYENNDYDRGNWEMLNRLWAEWAELLVELRNLKETEEGVRWKLCTVFRFGMVVMNTLWSAMEGDEMGREEFQKMLEHGRWTEMSMIGPFLGKISPLERKKECSPMDSAALLRILGTSPNFEWVHSLSLFRLLKRLKGFRAFFCDKFGDIAEKKRRMESMIRSRKEFDWMERMFPEILRIDLITDKMKVSQYEQLFIRKSWSHEARRIEARLVVSMLLEEINARGSKVVNVAKLREIIGRELYPEGAEPARALCWLLYVIQYMDTPGYGNGEFIPEARAMEECVEQGGRAKQFRNQWEMIRTRHAQFLRQQMIGGIGIMPADVPGGRARVEKLVGTKLYRELLGHTANPNRDRVFFNDNLLADHYLGALFKADNELDRMVDKLAADFIVSVRWFDSEQQKGSKMAIFWKETGEEMLEMYYDQLFDSEPDKLDKIAIGLEELFDGLKTFLIENQNVVIEKKKLREKWDRMMKRAEMAGQIMATKTRGARGEMAKWVWERHAEELGRLMESEDGEGENGGWDPRMAEQFGKNLKRGLESSLDARKRCQYFLELDKIKELFEKNKIEFVVEEFEQEKSEEKIVEKVKDNEKIKKNKIKRKRKKEVNMEEIIKEEEEKVQNPEEKTDGEERSRKMSDQAENEVENMKNDQKNGGGKKKRRNRERKNRINSGMVNEDSLPNMIGEERVYSINEIDSREFLVKMYREFIADPKENDILNLLNLSALANEIEGRIEAKRQFMEKYSMEFEFEIWPNLTKELIRKWEKIGEKKVPKEREKMEELEKEMEEMLENVVGNEKRAEETKRDGKDGEKIVWDTVGQQMHRGQLAKAITANQQTEGAWHSMNKEGQIRVVTVLFGAENGNKKAREQRRKEFMEYLEQWKGAREQIKMDNALFEQINKNDFLEQHPTKGLYSNYFAENVQQIQSDPNFEAITFDQIMVENGLTGINDQAKNEINEQLDILRSIVKKWSKGHAKLLVVGSFLLQVHTSGSDIDLLCLCPEQIKLDNFFGSIKCEPDKWHKCEQNSLICQFFENLDIKSVKGIPSAWVPLIKLTLNSGLEFDIVFASIPGMKTVQINDENEGENKVEIEGIIRRLAEQIKNEKEAGEDIASRNIEQMERMLRSVAGYYSNLRLLEMIPDLVIFRKFVLALKHWAKSNFIYNNLLGFLGGYSLCVMASKLVLLYPGASVPFLLERFFLTFSIWEWPLPVHLLDISPDPLSWNPEEELRRREAHFGVGLYARLTMPVITPGYPEQNSTFNINWFTAKIIRGAMKGTLRELNTPHISNSEKWTNLFRGKSFINMYSHFFAISCVASDGALNDEFCGFVGTRIRSQLLASGECAQRAGVQFCHARPVNNCNGDIVQIFRTKYAKAVCRAWLVGIQMKKVVLGDGREIETAETHQLETEEKLRINENLKAELVDEIVESYKRVVLGMARNGDEKWMSPEAVKIKRYFVKEQNGGSKGAGTTPHFVHLSAKYMDREELIRRWRV